VVQFLAVPSRAASLLLIAICSILLAIASFVGMFGVPLALIMLACFFKYGLVTVEHVAAGRPGAPVLDVDMVHPLEQKKSLVLLLITGMFFAIYWAATFWVGPLGGALIGIAAVAVLPAVVAVQAVTDSVFKSLDPRNWFRLMLWLRGDYAIILGCIALFWLLLYLIVATDVVAWLPRFVRIALIMYGWISVLALIGGAVFERRQADGPDTTPLERYEEPMSFDERERLRDHQIDSIYGEWRSGAHKNAWQTLTRQVEQSEDPIAELCWMHERISRWPDFRLGSRVAQELIPRLLAVSRFGEAINLTRQRLKVDPDFRPVTAADTLRMVRIARDGGDRPTARALLRDFQRVFPNDTLQPVAKDLEQQLER